MCSFFIARPDDPVGRVFSHMPARLSRSDGEFTIKIVIARWYKLPDNFYGSFHYLIYLLSKIKRDDPA
jgi:hypothetical protein